ncbi:MAG TPA: TonB-dependent receptor [Steroidobacteraceae bacterium]|jgi:outer membrane receptor protein involved in Fe transport
MNTSARHAPSESLRPRPLRLFIAAALGAGATAALLPAGSAFAQSEDALQPVVVTGSRIRREASATDTAVPMLVIDQQQLVDRGFVQVGQVLNESTSVVPSQPLTPFNGASSGGGEQVPALFGLGPGRTLTLVNGRRFVSTASGFGVPGSLSGSTNDSVVDTNIIPTGLLQRVEIVQGGGAAVYGSDAMGGVINYVLRDDFEGLEFDARYGQTDRDDYPVMNGRITWGANFAGRGNVAVNLEWSKTEPLYSTERPRSALARVTMANPADTGPSDGISSLVPVFDARFWEFNYNGVLFAPPSPVAFPTRAFITIDGIRYNQFAGVGTPAQFNDAGTGLVAFDPGVFPSAGPSIPFASGGDGFTYVDLGALYSGVERRNTNLLAHYDLTDRVRLSTELLYSEVEGEDPFAAQASNTILNSAATGSGVIAVAAANPFLSASARQTIIDFLNANPALFGPNSGFGWAAGAPLPVSLSKFWPDLLNDRTGTRELDTFRSVLALDGEFGGAGRDFYWSLSGSYARTGGAVRSWGIWQTRFNNAINARPGPTGPACGINVDADPSNDDPDCVAINPFGVGNVTQAMRDYVNIELGQDFENTQYDWLATLGGTLFTLPGGDAKFSLAYEHRSERSVFIPTDAAQLGLGRGAVATPPQSGRYNTHEYSLEVAVPLVGGDLAVPGVRGLELTGAFRTVDNSIAGTEEVWNAGLRWSIVDDLALRVSRSRNFRAPNLAQLFSPVTSGLEAIAQDPCDVDRINLGPDPAVRRANCEALFAANPGYGPLATFQDPAENFPIAVITRGGNPDLRNELSDTWTYGVVLQPRFAPGLSIVADRVEVDLEDGLSFFTPQNFLATCFDSSPQPADICAVTTRDAVGTVIASSAVTFNAGSIKFRGETYNIAWQGALGGGNLGLNLEATHVALLETSVTGVDLTRTDGSAAQPDWRARFDARWDRGPWRLAYALNWLPGTKVLRESTIENNPDPRLSANYRHSVSAQYQISEQFSVRAGVENLTDEQPSYPTLYYGDILGRQYYLAVTVRQ